MKLTLILPKWKHGAWDIQLARMPPFALLTLASCTPKEWEIEIIDQNQDELEYQPTDLVGITAMTPLANRAYKIADEYRQRGIKVILGGIHPSMMPNEAIKHSDSVVIGETEAIWAEVLNDFKNDNLKKIYRVKSPPDLSKVPPLRRELIKHDYFFSNFVQTTRGCPFGCDFCSVSKFSGRKVRTKPIPQVLAEIENFQKQRILKKPFFFIDDNIVANPAYAKKLFQAIKPLNLEWCSQASITIAKDKTLLKLAKESGCIALFIGFESVTQQSLKEVHKAYQVKEYEKLIKRIHDQGIVIFGSFIFGFDHDRKDIFEKTIDFCKKINLNIAVFNILTPLPGTELFKRLKEEKRITTYNWDHYDNTNVVFKPKNMSAQELREGIKWSYGNFYSGQSITKRIISQLPKVGWKYSLISLYANYDFQRRHNLIFR